MVPRGQLGLREVEMLIGFQWFGVSGNNEWHEGGGKGFRLYKNASSVR